MTYSIRTIYEHLSQFTWPDGMYNKEYNVADKNDFIKILRHITFTFKDIFYGKEKDINLAISKKLGKLLEEEGYEVVMTRKEDVGLYDSESRNKKVQDMQKRCQMIKETKPLLTVSIHQNSYPDEQVCGPQVFYYTDSVNGEKLAKCIQEALNEELEVSRPRTEKANNTYYLLKRSEGVLTIVECGFLSNGREAALLNTAEYQERVAEAVRDGILTYLEKT